MNFVSYSRVFQVSYLRFATSPPPPNDDRGVVLTAAIIWWI